MAEIPAQARRVDGKIQDRDGLSDAGDRRVAVQRRRRQLRQTVLWLGIFLVLLAFAAWIFGEFVQRGRIRKGVALAVVLILLVGGYAFALENQLHWRTPFADADTTALKESPDGIDWQRWSPEAVAKARSEGRPVLVDFTADWCLTCQVNKKTSIEIPSVRAKLKEINAVALLGDYTHFPDTITAELNRFNRAGVPLVWFTRKIPMPRQSSCRKF